MLQQTTVATVGPYFQRFIARWPSVTDLAAADLDRVLQMWAGLGYYSRARNLHACAQIVAQNLDGKFPQTELALRALPGIGPYTAAAIRAIAFGQPAVVVDGNIERVITRLYNSPLPLKENKAAIRAWAGRLTPQCPTQRPGDYAQAMMDLGAMICRPKTPTCPICPLSTYCKAHRAGTAPDLPHVGKRAQKPVRHGFAYIITREDGAILIEKRPPKGLLGGMDGLPSSSWGQEAGVPLPGTQDLGLGIKHTFTHFHVHLSLYSGPATLAKHFPNARFVHHLLDLALPTLFIKVLKAANRLS